MGSHNLASGLRKAGVPYATRHLFLCLGPDCCPMREGERVWDYLKRRCKDLAVPVMRTKAGCFRVCEDGPLLVVYPEGTWYTHVTMQRLERILQQHIVRGQPVEEWAVATNNLSRACPSLGTACFSPAATAPAATASAAASEPECDPSVHHYEGPGDIHFQSAPPADSDPAGEPGEAPRPLPPAAFASPVPVSAVD